MHGPIDEVYRRIRRNRMIEIHFLDHMDVGLSIIRSMPETRDVQIEDHRVTVELAADDDQVAELLGEARGRRRADALLRRQGADAGRRVHAGDEGGGGVGGAMAARLKDHRMLW